MLNRTDTLLVTSFFPFIGDVAFKRPKDLACRSLANLDVYNKLSLSSSWKEAYSFDFKGNGPDYATTSSISQSPVV